MAQRERSAGNPLFATDRKAYAIAPAMGDRIGHCHHALPIDRRTVKAQDTRYTAHGSKYI